MKLMTRPRSGIPLVSFVATARNDNHGGNLLRRIRAFSHSIAALAHRSRVPCELVVVDWNPPEDVPRMHSALDWPGSSQYFNTRIIEVPREIHAQFHHHDVLPLYQMIGKNVGIRRAHGEFILCTNIDIVFEESFFQFMAEGGLKKRTIYRADRYDVDENIPVNASIDELLRFCRTNVVRINNFKGSFNLETNEGVPFYADDAEHNPDAYEFPVLHTNACGDFQLAHRDHWFELLGYAEFDMYSFHIDSLFQISSYYHGLAQRTLREPIRIYHIEHPTSGWKPELGVDTRHSATIKKGALQKMSHELLSALQRQMKEQKAPLFLNSPDWGLAAYELPEIDLSAEPRGMEKLPPALTMVHDLLS
jgi:hypothetical protein